MLSPMLGARVTKTVALGKEFIDFILIQSTNIRN